jgi:membrane protein YqaA with SNARE-associated domain
MAPSYLRALGPGASRRLAFAWAVAEATCWPIMPDAILAPLGARHPSSWWNLALAALSGTALGGAASYALGASERPAGPILARLPMVREPMVTAVDDWLATEGPSAVRRQALSGIPFKVFALRAGARRIPLGPFLAWALLGRGARFFTVSGAAALLGRWFGEPLGKHGPTLLLAWSLVFALGLWRTVRAWERR